MRRILMTWNPGPANDEQWNPEAWDDEMVEPTLAGEGVMTSWSVARRRNGIEAGDLAYMLRQGAHGRGLVAMGEILSTPETGEHWSGDGRETNYVEIDWWVALPLSKMITISQLELLVPDFHWNQVFSSGREIKSPDAQKLDELFGVLDPAGDQDELEVRGAFFGDPVHNREIEIAAMDVVTERYELEDYFVTDVSDEKLGYDLVASKGAKEQHIEVKGTSGTGVAFLLTRHEYDTARTDPDWILVVVTAALGDAPGYYELDPETVVDHAEPMVYQVRVPEERFV
ncbi:DUF3883 domain-containing protein [Intrasporangium calvum]|uniref:Protein NO VEIN C-terminal domain-containing protein n=1 Tax=Intrasporangium calvum (strain ATCC 23552 / DSM 43043 / JCM 3097 / NBRC 12989 / NCIMB 10167 / NRRL B-3866 / 7 KIP) TaxID=710696 RepID=E6SCJ7_INTC7|nr:DUF3883 domain-containing protein [Intrasporangium calvum]ADU49601.1 hypothetical protein Intca_3115 [Intrasporangium calvum DSM 43043]